jgi:hypothetical protein
MRDNGESNKKKFIKIGSEINPVRVTQTHRHTHRHTDTHTDRQDLAKSSFGHFSAPRRPIWTKFCMLVPDPILKIGVKFGWIFHYTFHIVSGNA